MIITIDGPVASGKSTVAKRIAKKLGIYYLYTGLLYRAVAYVLLEKLVKTIASFSSLLPADLTFIDDILYEYIDGRVCILFAGKDITSFLSLSTVDHPASIVSANQYVREALLPLQQAVAERYDLIADGRDCGTVVFPNADYKFYLTASIEERAKRVFNDPKQRRGVYKNLEAAIEDIQKRDDRDMQRAIAPLKVPDNAVTIDNSNMTIEETVEEVLKHVK